MTSPGPVARQVCLICGQLWDKHLERAAWRFYAETDDEQLGEFQDLPEQAQVDLVNLQDCIALLKDANTGPMGPQGPQGAMGIAGRNA